jgi:hypothetical protein
MSNFGKEWPGSKLNRLVAHGLTAVVYGATGFCAFKKKYVFAAGSV